MVRPQWWNRNREWTITIECRGDCVLIQNTRQRIGLDTLAQGQPDANPLYTAVRSMIDRRQSGVLPGETPYRPQIRFLVRTDGLRTYYTVYPILASLRVPMVRETLQE